MNAKLLITLGLMSLYYILYSRNYFVNIENSETCNYIKLQINNISSVLNHDLSLIGNNETTIL